MVVRTRFAALFIPLAYYMISGSVGGYFIWHAFNGERGLKAKTEYRRQLSEIEDQLKQLRGERAHWERRIALVRGEAIDRDLLDEESRILLNRAHKNELVIMAPAPAASVDPTN